MFLKVFHFISTKLSLYKENFQSPTISKLSCQRTSRTRCSDVTGRQPGHGRLNILDLVPVPHESSHRSVRPTAFAGFEVARGARELVGSGTGAVGHEVADLKKKGFCKNVSLQ